MDNNLFVNAKIDGEPYQIKCKYLVGADGVKSKVRQNIGVEMQG